jgi:eukaryotic-like serine/threonine-protein kinase
MTTKRRILDRYRLTERLASGGSAEVWRARDDQLQRDVAVKLLHPHLLPDKRSRGRLVAEARAAASLSHPGIVGIYDVDITGDAPALVMELVDGEPLAARLDRTGPIPPAEAARIVAEVSEALFHAHKRGVVHRDVKPGNILLERDGRARLVDFGIAHSLAETAERLTLTGTVIGTLRYMGPEQLTGEPITPRTDLYGLGTVLHEALTGRAPFPSSTPVGLVEAQRAGPPPMDDVDPALASLTRACLAFDPAGRPLHAGALADALRAWLAGDPQPALAIAPVPVADTQAVTQPMGQVPASAVAPVVTPDAVAAAAPVVASSAPPRTARAPARRAGGRRRESSVPAVVLAALALVALVGLGAFALRSGDVLPGLGEPTATPATPTPVATPSPQPTEQPGWAREILEEAAQECDQATVDQLAIEIATMNPDQAKDYWDNVKEQCQAAQGDD